MKDINNVVENLAFVDSSGKFIDGADFANLNLKFPRLERLLDDIMRRNEFSRLIYQSRESMGEVWIRRLDSKGNFWKVWQEREIDGESEENPSIRFIYHPDHGVVRPVDYADPFVQLEGNRRTAQLLISSFLTHWLSGVLVLAEERDTFRGLEEVVEMERDLF